MTDDNERKERVKQLTFWVKVLFVVLAVSANVYLVVLALICRHLASQSGNVWFLFFVGVAGLGIGNLLGFLYAAGKTDEVRFDKALVFVNGLLGGALIADLAKGSDGFIYAGLDATARGCGIPENGAGPVAAIFLALASVGFLNLYLNKQYVLNELAKLHDADAVELKGERKLKPDKGSSVSQIVVGVPTDPPIESAPNREPN